MADNWVIAVMRGIGHPSLPFLVFVPVVGTGLSEVCQNLLGGNPLVFTIQTPGAFNKQAVRLEVGRNSVASTIVIPSENTLMGVSLKSSSTERELDNFSLEFSKMHRIADAKGNPIAPPWALAMGVPQMHVEQE